MHTGLRAPGTLAGPLQAAAQTRPAHYSQGARPAFALSVCAFRFYPLRPTAPALHTPPAGTTFGNVLIPWACPRLPADFQMSPVGMPWAGWLPPACAARFRTVPHATQTLRIGGHLSLEGRSDEELGGVFTMLRSSKVRCQLGRR